MLARCSYVLKLARCSSFVLDGCIGLLANFASAGLYMRKRRDPMADKHGISSFSQLSLQTQPLDLPLYFMSQTLSLIGLISIRPKLFPFSQMAYSHLPTKATTYQVIIDCQFHLDMEAYEREGPRHLSTMFAIYYGFNFACLTLPLLCTFSYSMGGKAFQIKIFSSNFSVL